MWLAATITKELEPHAFKAGIPPEGSIPFWRPAGHVTPVVRDAGIKPSGPKTFVTPWWPLKLQLLSSWARAKGRRSKAARRKEESRGPNMASRPMALEAQH